MSIWLTHEADLLMRGITWPHSVKDVAIHEHNPVCWQHKNITPVVTVVKYNYYYYRPKLSQNVFRNAYNLKKTVPPLRKKKKNQFREC